MIRVNKNGRFFHIHFLKHMLHHSNVENVLINGLLSHKHAHEKGLIKVDISLAEVQERRARRSFELNGTVFHLHEFVPFYFTTRNPMLYKRRGIQDELVILCADPEIITRELTIFTDGNAANYATNFYMGFENLINVPFELTTTGSWNHEDEMIKKENKRKMCAEILAYSSVDIDSINMIACPNDKMRQFVENVKSKVGHSASHIDIEVRKDYFFI